MRHIAVEAVVFVGLMRAVKRPHLIQVALGGKPQICSLPLSQSVQGLGGHPKAESDRPIDTSSHRASLTCRDVLVNIAAHSCVYLLLELSHS